MKEKSPSSAQAKGVLKIKHGLTGCMPALDRQSPLFQSLRNSFGNFKNKHFCPLEMNIVTPQFNSYMKITEIFL